MVKTEELEKQLIKYEKKYRETLLKTADSLGRYGNEIADAELRVLEDLISSLKAEIRKLQKVSHTR